MKTLIITEKEEIEQIIAKCTVCFVGLADTDLTPYVIPMNFGYKEGTVYLHSAQEVACSYRMRSKSVIGWGTVLFEEDFDKKKEALDIIMHQYTQKEFTYSDPAVKNVKIWKVALDTLTCKVFGEPHKK